MTRPRSPSPPPARRPRGPGRLTAEDAERLPDRLLDAAQAVFIGQGYARATMDAIAREAGASRKTIYARYAGKEQILAAVLQRLADRAAPLAVAAAGGPPDASEDARTALLRQARTLEAAVTSPATTGLSRLILSEAHQFPEVAQVTLQMQGRAVDIVRVTLERLRDMGQLPRLDNAPRAARIFVEMAVGVQRRQALLGQPVSRRESDALIQAAVDIFLQGCA